MRILVTGTSGFVGSAIASELKAAGHEVHGMSRTPSRPNCVTHDHRFDLSQPLVLALSFDVVIHCAALSSPWAHPNAYFKANVVATRNIIDFCHQHPETHLIFISSSSVHYENADQFNLTEASALPLVALNEYAKTKTLGEALVKEYKGPWTIVRPRAVYGPGDTVLFPRILRAAKKRRLPLIERPDGKSVMGDLIYIHTLTAYITTIIAKKVTGTFILTNNEPVNVNEFLLSLLSDLNLPLPKRKLSLQKAMLIAKFSEWVSATLFNYREPPVTQFGVSVFAYSKTFNVANTIQSLGQPAYSNQQGIEKFIHWWRNHDNH